MSLLGFILIATGLLIGRAAYRSALLSAQIGKVAEEGREESTYGDRPAVPSALIVNAGDDLAGVPGARLDHLLHDSRR